MHTKIIVFQQKDAYFYDVMKDKETLYKEILPQAASLLEGETDEVACMANLAALLHRTFGFWWTGF